MKDNFYQQIFKRKSFHLFRNCPAEPLNEEILLKIKEKYYQLNKLYPNIITDIQIVKGNYRGEQYDILFYSEIKDNYLRNIGYIGEQLDLYLTGLNIGCLWYGMGKPAENEYNGLKFVIMMLIKKVPDDKFRKDMFKSKRKDIAEVWWGENHKDVGNIVRFAPSACNSQPWLVKDNAESLEVYRYRKKGRVGIMPKDKVSYYNQIDIGIFLLFIEVVLQERKITFERKLFDDKETENESVLSAIYYLK
ncbi:MAG: nitroreductase family protein [Erysipelotrichia bacterium]|nr:nitroreductase family protein [Erysipelotrichia bacterium]